MPFSFVCPHCGAKLRVPDEISIICTSCVAEHPIPEEAALSTLKCPKCGKRVSAIEVLKQAHKQFDKVEPRCFVYNAATRLIDQSWGKPSEVAEALGVLLLVWNSAFFRLGCFSIAALVKCIKDNDELINTFRKRYIHDYKREYDGDNITSLFWTFLEALEIQVRGELRRTPVGVVKALHLLAPAFFPLWDMRIARAYNCGYANDPLHAYLCFTDKIKAIAEKIVKSDEVKDLENQTGMTLIKLIDEYNYVTYTLTDREDDEP